jgi:hypothetical protein
VPVPLEQRAFGLIAAAGRSRRLFERKAPFVRNHGNTKGAALERAAFFVLDEEAGVLDYQEACGLRFCCGQGVREALLKPEAFGANCDGGIGDAGNAVGTAEDVDYVDGDGDVFEAGIGFLAEDLGFVGIDGDNLVAGALKVGSDFVRGTHRIRGETDDGDGFGFAEQLCDRVGEVCHVCH